MADGYAGTERQNLSLGGESRYRHRDQQAGLLSMWPFGLTKKKPSKEHKIEELKLAVSRERTKLFSNLENLDRVTQSHDFDAMVQRSLRLMESKK